MRIPFEVAARVRAGHPWIYREALGGRPLREAQGEILELVDPEGAFVARGVYDPESILAVRVASRSVDEVVGPAMVRDRIRDAIALRKRVGPSDSDAVRLVNAECDDLPGVVVESWANTLVVQLFSPAVLAWRDAIYDALEAELGKVSIYEQRRFRPIGAESSPRLPAELVRGPAAPVEIEVTEAGLRFGIDVTAPVSVGLFLELREGRRAIGAWAPGRRVLNLFSYAGAISAWAKRAGAKEVVAVDSVAKAHARSRHNLGLSGFDPESVEHITGDVMKTLERFADRGRRFDLVVLDPPAFGTAAKGKVWAADKELRDLVAAALTVLEPGGVLAATTGTHKISHDDFDRALAEGASRAGTRLAIIERRFLPADFAVPPGFPEASTLKFAIAIRS